MTGRTVLHWVLHAVGLREADTQLTAAERGALARHAAGRRQLVELGVMHGATTRLLCEVKAPDGVVTGIDPFPPGRLGVSFELAIARREVRAWRPHGVRLLRCRSEAAAASWQTPIDFLFIDADHAWPAVARDWRDWAGWVVPGGVVALHDSREVPGRPVYDSVRFTAEVVRRDDRFVLLEEIDSLTVLQRSAGARS